MNDQQRLVRLVYWLILASLALPFGLGILFAIFAHI